MRGTKPPIPKHIHDRNIMKRLYLDVIWF